MFDSVLDFQFAFDNQRQREFVHDVHPGKGESSDYIPTAGGIDKGESFAIISVFHNPDYGGRVLIIVGATGKDTKAAADLMADPARWAATLQPCDLAQDASHQSLQVLLNLETTAGSTSSIKTASCHVLNSGF